MFLKPISNFLLLTCFRADGNALVNMTSQVKLELFEGNIEISLVARAIQSLLSVQLSNWRAERKLIQEAVIMLVSYCFSYCNFVIYFEQSSVWWLQFFLLLLRLLWLLRVFHGSIWISGLVSLVLWKYHWDFFEFHWICWSLWVVWYFNNIKSSRTWMLDVCAFICVFFNVLQFFIVQVFHLNCLFQVFYSFVSIINEIVFYFLFG